jgi:hypothetical protein
MIRTTMAVTTALTLSLSTVAHAMSLGECVIRNDAADKKVPGILTLRPAEFTSYAYIPA